jgi:hypothetical protein
LVFSLSALLHFEYGATLAHTLAEEGEAPDPVSMEADG